MRSELYVHRHHHLLLRLRERHAKHYCVEHVHDSFFALQKLVFR